jgi:putative oxidoreductase
MENHQAVAEVVGRAMLALLFLFQGITAIPRFAHHSAKLRKCSVPMPDLVLACGLAFMIGGGAMVLTGFFAEFGAGLLIVFTLVATVLFQNFWSIEDPDLRKDKRGSFLYNLAVMGGLLLIL